MNCPQSTPAGPVGPHPAPQQATPPAPRPRTWAAIRDHQDQLVPFFSLPGDTAATLQAQAEALGLALARWIETILRVHAETEETRSAYQVDPGPPELDLELSLDPATHSRLALMTRRWEEYADAGDAAQGLLMYVTHPSYVRLAQELAGRAPDEVAAALVARTDELMATDIRELDGLDWPAVATPDGTEVPSVDSRS